MEWIDFVTARVGASRWCVAPRMTPRLLAKGYERVIRPKTYAKWKLHFKSGDDPLGVVVTDYDRRALGKIKRSGFVGITLTGEPWLQSNDSIDQGCLLRLIRGSFLVAASPGLFPDFPQSYELTERGRRYAGE